MNADYSSNLSGSLEDLWARLADLERSEKKYRDFFGNASDILFSSDLDGKFDILNPAALNLIGLTLEGARQITFFDLMTPDSQVLARQKIIEKMAGAPTTNYEIEIINAQELITIVSLSTRLVYEDGHPVGIQGTGRDVTEKINAQKRLEASEEKFRTLTLNSQALIYILTGDGFAYTNPAVNRLLEYSDEELQAMKWWDVVHPEHREIAKNRGLARQLRQPPLEGDDMPYRYELHVVTKSGVSKWIELSVAPIPFEGQPSILISAYEISERKKMEEELRASEARYRALSDVSFEGIVISDNGICIEANQWIADLLDYQVEDMIGQETAGFGAPESYEIMAQHLAQGYELPYEANLLSSQGEHIPVEIRGRMFYYLGRVVRASTVRDLRERYWAREKITEQHRNFQALFYNTPDAVAFCNRNQLVMDINPRFYELFGFTPEECRGHRVNDLLVPEELQMEHEEINQRLSKGESITTESVRMTKNGQLIDVMIRVVNMAEYGFYAIYSDISQRKRTERIVQEQLRELEGKNAEMERFTYTVSHDLRSPLITIKGFAGLLLDDLKHQRSERLESDLERICNAADKMDHLLRDLLELSRVGRMLNSYSLVNMNSLAGSVAELLTGSLSARGVQVKIQPGMPAVSADEARIQEVLQNLIENAVKFMGPQSDPQIAIGYECLKNEHLFYVRDNGIGIDPVYQHRIFGLFDQLDPRYEGTGIGLSLVKRIVELHKGRIWVESEGNGQGSTFYFTLPITENNSTREG